MDVALEYEMSQKGLFPQDEFPVPPQPPISKWDREKQIQEMRRWFFDHYTDPGGNTPYESAEGGYIYIWGGPYDAQYELEGEFGGLVPEDVIEELAKELNDITPEWTGNPNEQALDDYEFYLASTTAHYQAFDLAMTNVDLLLRVEVKSNLLQPFLRLLYANAITALETYLFDFFYAAIKADQQFFKRFVETNPDFQRNIKLSQVLLEHSRIEQTVKESLIQISWHNLPRIKTLYKDVLQIEFDEDKMRELLPSIAIRHDIVHRNGKNKNDVEMTLSSEQMVLLVKLVKSFADHIEDAWQTRSVIDFDSNSPF
jgi:hypothetical protein